MPHDDRFWADRLVAVTGGTGFLGVHLVSQLLANGARVRVLSLPPLPSHPLRRLAGVDLIDADVRDTAKVRPVLDGCSVVFHLAGIVGAWRQPADLMRSVHVDGTRAVLASAPREARIVHTSSIMTVGASRKAQLLDENARFNLNELKLPYCHSKRESEELALSAAGDRDVVVANPAWLIGPEDHEPSVLGRFCIRFWKGRVLIAPPGGLNLVDVRDAAAGHLRAAERGTCGERYILGGENLSWLEVIRQMAQTADFKPRGLAQLPKWAFTATAGLSECRALFTGKEPYPSLAHVRVNRYHWFYSSIKAQRELGFHSRPLVETLAETHAWFSARQQIKPRGFNQWWMRPQTVASLRSYQL